MKSRDGAETGSASSERQSESRPGLEGQRRAIAAACTRRGWQLLERVEDAGRSAQQPNRHRGDVAAAQAR
jgi:DNA invertase Pin-like site-specific DNA recombinase